MSADTVLSLSIIMQRKAQAGFHMNRIPLGYRRVPEAGAFVRIEPDHQKLLVVSLFELVAAGASVRSARSTVFHDALTENSPSVPSVSSIHRILRNPFYIGKVRFNGKEFDGNHPALITPLLFRKVQVRLGQHRV